jgi:alcohol dehydrogenase class IV
MYKIGFPQKVYSGLGSVSELPQILSEKKAQKVLVMTDQGVSKQSCFQKVMDLLSEYEKVCIDDIPPEPSVYDIQRVYEKASQAGTDAVVAVGGGSVMDMTKMIAACLTNPDYTADVQNTAKIVHTPALTIMIPTTAGTGAEATPNAIFLFPEQNLKVGIVSDHFVASCVIWDGEMTASLPKSLTASTGIDALCHAVESYISIIANPLSKTLSKAAIQGICANLERAWNDGSDMQARQNMLEAAFLAGVCLTSSSTVAVHALSYPLGGKYHIPHGISNAILLAPVMQVNLPDCRKEFTELAPLMLPDVDSIPKEKWPEAVVTYMKELCKRIEIADSLKPFGVSSDDLDYLTDNAMEVKRLLLKNPRALTREEIRGIYEGLLE